jgi:Fe-S-cluster containining protein
MEMNEWVTGDVVLSIGGEPLKMQMTVPAGPVKPHRMLPVFQKMTNSFVEMSAMAAGARGETVSCRAGCGACCRQPVPIAEIEIYHLAEIVAAMPEPRQSEIRQRFRDAVGHFRAMGWFDRMKAIGDLTLTESEAKITAEMQKAIAEYFLESVACPFLEDESCSIHEDRPIACREYLVTSPAANCATGSGEGVKMVDLVLKPSHTLRYVGATGTFTGFIPLVLALEFAEKFPERFEEKTGERWAADFFGKLTHQRIPKEGIERGPEEHSEKPF